MFCPEDLIRYVLLLKTCIGKWFKDFQGNHSLGSVWLGFRPWFQASTLGLLAHVRQSWTALGREVTVARYRALTLNFPYMLCLSLFMIKKKKHQIFLGIAIYFLPPSLVNGTVLSDASFYKLNIHVLISSSLSHTQTGYWWQSSDRVWFHLPCAPTDCCSHTLWIKSCSLHTPKRVMTLQS